MIVKLYYSSTDKQYIPYFYEIIEKIEGVSLYNVWHAFSEEQREDMIKQLCKTMKQIHSNVICRIHNIDLRNDDTKGKTRNIDSKYYIDLAKEKDSIIYNMIYDKLDILKESMNKENELADKLPRFSSIYHNDMNNKNVIWSNDNYKLIDLEFLRYSNPYLELYELLL